MSSAALPGLAAAPRAFVPAPLGVPVEAKAAGEPRLLSSEAAAAANRFEEDYHDDFCGGDGSELSADEYARWAAGGGSGLLSAADSSSAVGPLDPRRRGRILSDLRELARSGVRFTPANPVKTLIRSGKITASSSAADIHSLAQANPVLSDGARRRKGHRWGRGKDRNQQHQLSSVADLRPLLGVSRSEVLLAEPSTSSVVLSSSPPRRQRRQRHLGARPRDVQVHGAAHFRRATRRVGFPDCLFEVR